MSEGAFGLATWISALPFLLGAATLTWLLSLPLRNVSLADPLWSLMLFMAGVIYALAADPRAPRLSLVLWLLAIWAFRLALHVTRRNAGAGEARRYRELREKHQPGFGAKSLYLVFWYRAGLAWLVSLPLLGAFASNRPLGWLDGVGALLWLLGFVVEAVADWQLARFHRDAANEERVLDRGLWRWSRHPNYFGECCLWWGFALIGLSAAGGSAWWVLISPLLVTALLLRAAGVAPFAGKASQADHGRRGNTRPQYADYVLKTNAFFPGPRRK